MAETMNVHQKIVKARTAVLAAGMKKSGFNSFAKFNYFELDDISPVVEPICEKLGLVLWFETFKRCLDGETIEDTARMTVFNADDPEDFIYTECPIDYGKHTMQDIGAAITYSRRYLLMMVFDLAECDTIDATTAREEKPKAAQDERKATAKQIDLISKRYKGANLQKLLLVNGIEKLEDLPLRKASEIIAKITEKDAKREAAEEEVLK